MTLIVLFGFVLFLAPLARAVDCVCVKEPHRSDEKVKADRREAYDQATEVFEGKVISLDAYSVKFKLQKRWKGNSSNEVTLSTGAVRGQDGTPLPAECSYQFHLGDEYLVYAYGPVDKMQGSTCLTLQIKKAAEEEKGLDQIKRHEVVGESP
jgi:hypothetical protein